MADFFTSGQKASLEGVFVNVHDTFARNITIYKKKKAIFVATNQTYNALYSSKERGRVPPPRAGKQNSVFWEGAIYVKAIY